MSYKRKITAVIKSAIGYEQRIFEERRKQNYTSFAYGNV